MMFMKLGLFFAFVLAVPLLGILIILTLGRSELRTQQQAYLAAGGILEMAQFKPPPIADEVNAAKYFEPVFDFLDQLTEEEQRLLGDEARVSDPALHLLLLKCDETIRAVRTAARLPQCNWDIQYELEGFNLKLPHLGKLRTTEKLLTSNIRRAAAQALELGEDHDEIIIRDIETIFHLARHCNEDATVLGQLIAFSFISTGMELYHELFNDHPAPNNEIAEILTLVQQRVSAKRTIQYETLIAQTNWKQMQDTTTFSGGNSWSNALFRNWERAFYLERMRTALQNSERPFYERIEPPVFSWYTETAEELLSSFDLLERHYAQVQLKIELFKTAERLRAYKVEHGTYPVPESGAIKMPIDPVTGKLIQYEIVNDGFKLTGLVGHPEEDEITWSWED